MSNDCEVTRFDQTLINRFARLNAKCEELEADLAVKKQSAQNTREAIDELFLQEEHVLINCGEVLARMTLEEATQWCEDLSSQLTNQIAEKETEVESIRAEMLSIKSRLYAKFGQNINLESDD